MAQAGGLLQYAKSGGYWLLRAELAQVQIPDQEIQAALEAAKHQEARRESEL